MEFRENGYRDVSELEAIEIKEKGEIDKVHSIFSCKLPSCIVE